MYLSRYYILVKKKNFLRYGKFNKSLFGCFKWECIILIGGEKLWFRNWIIVKIFL